MSEGREKEMMEYRNVVVLEDGTISGEQRNPNVTGTWKMTDAKTGEVHEYELGGWSNFSAERRRWTIREALDRYPHLYDPIWGLQDGYGFPGGGPEWDWSGIRDSSEDALDEMFALASEYFTPDEAEAVLGVRWTS